MASSPAVIHLERRFNRGVLIGESAAECETLSIVSGDSSTEDYNVSKVPRFTADPVESSYYSDGSAAASPPPILDTVPDWSPAHSSHLYNCAGWGDGYFSVNVAGDLCVTPKGGGCQCHQWACHTIHGDLHPNPIHGYSTFQ
jgi:hypothetical protein